MNKIKNKIETVFEMTVLSLNIDKICRFKFILKVENYISYSKENVRYFLKKV